jgi:CHAT domain-containing protein/Tfp pilus assembly protein PilF
VHITSLERGAARSGQLSGDVSDWYSVELAAGQFAEVVVEQRGIDVVVELLDPKQKVVAVFDSDPRPQGQEHAAFVAHSDVTFALRVKPRYPRLPAGRYEIRLAEVRAADERDVALDEAYRLSTEAAALKEAGKYDEAIDRAQRALDAAEKARGPDDPYVADLDIRLALLLRSKGDLAKARPLAERALNISQRQLGAEDLQTADALNTLGLLYHSAQDNAKAEQCLEQALEITEKTLGPEHPSVIGLLMSLALQHEDRRDFARAVPELQRGLAIANKTLAPDAALSMMVLHDLGDAYLYLEELDNAERITRQAFERLAQKYGPDHPNLSNPLQNLGIIARQRGHYSEALELFERAHRIRETTLGPQHPYTAAVLINIGNVHKDVGEFAKARDLYQRALDILEVSAGPYHQLTLMALANLSNVYRAEGDAVRAVEYQARVNQVVEKNIELNLAIGSERAKLAYAEGIGERTNSALSLHFRDAPDNRVAAELAVTVLLQRKARVLDAMTDSRTILRQRLGPGGQRLLDELGNVTANLAAAALNGPGKISPAEYAKQLASLEEQREKIEAEISRQSAGYYESSLAVTLSAVRAAIPPDAVLVEYATYHPFDPAARDTGRKPLGELRYVVYVIPHEGEIRWKDLGDARSIDSAVGSLRQALRDPDRADVRKLSRTVHSKVVEPLAGLFGGARHLLLSPEGQLQLIPFEALLSENGRYLVQDYATTYLTTGRDLLRMQVARESGSPPLIVANPSFGAPSARSTATGAVLPSSAPSLLGARSVTSGGDFAAVYFAPLPGSALEARAIQSLLPDAKLLTGKQATQSALQRVDAPSILHIATHGFFLQDVGSRPKGSRSPAIGESGTLQNPLLRSGLALSGANLAHSGNDDGILTALEAANLNLWGTKLVTLSACDTGIGEVKNGEGVLGLRRAFFLAGTESLVMSLWPVSDAVTREVMTSYYAGLRHGLGRGEALRQAQLTMLKRQSRRHPFFWASFIQSGAWSPITTGSEP